jgi:hypothetical protein
MQLKRLFRHLILPHWWVLRAFPTDLLQRRGGSCGLGVDAWWRVAGGGRRPICRCLICCGSVGTRTRAIELFSQLRVWDTEQNSGVLIYLQLIDRRVEIVADRGIDASVGQAFWDGVCRRMEAAFRREDGDFEGGKSRCLYKTEQFRAEGIAMRRTITGERR